MSAIWRFRHPRMNLIFLNIFFSFSLLTIGRGKKTEISSAVQKSVGFARPTIRSGLARPSQGQVPSRPKLGRKNKARRLNRPAHKLAVGQRPLRPMAT
ncbi:hypothetical protein QYF36_011460 [Acer negundo]|nr:hypothetical protein QYF36_011460 [Acer negundo]